MENATFQETSFLNIAFLKNAIILGLLSGLGPLKIRRTDEKCVHCHFCSVNCPSLIDVEKKKLVDSPECFACMTCISSCPSPEALNITVKIGRVRRRLKPYLYPLILVLLFYFFIGLGMVAGKWNSQIPYSEYERIITALYQK